ncbi:PaaI family thioesterase [Mycolicibacterium arseniciresistens]|uniref:PaaI family thioesterase n=1 Tax=Mycolicibacterium arseniciresistens TaxID=3062257 RepID=A0ABT8UG52_9MYCO|nr:PaaI family thioesterase [Mycolicibacterium arseniciresistens]MDO3636752.1 PaaI family thioesterase [Mycolicibacterium arseniciresistens]
MTATDPAVRPTDPVGAAQYAAGIAEPEFGRYFLIHFLGLSIDYVDDDKACVVRLPFARHLCNAGGAMHGGVLSTALDISMGHACQRYLSAGSTIEMQVRFLRAVRTDVTCTGRVVHGGRRIVQLESHMHDTAGRLVATASGSWFRHDATT